MGSSSNVSWLVLGFFLVLLPSRCPMFVKGDAAFEEKVCNKTTEPNFCQICFDSDPKSITQVLSGLGCISVNCTFNQAVIVHNFLALYASSSAIDKEAKDLAATCVPIFDNIKNYLATTLEECRKGDYDDTYDRALNVNYLSQNCTAHHMPLTKFPSEFGEALVKYEALPWVIIGVVSQLHTKSV